MAQIRDKLEVTILENGGVRVESDKVSAPNHASAEAFLRILSEYMGGDSVRVKRGHHGHHTHEEEHVHDNAEIGGKK